MRNMIKLIKEFLSYRKLKQNLLESSPLNFKLKRKLSEQDKDLEKEIAQVLVWELIKLHLRWEFSYEYMRGYRDALDFRVAMIRKYEVKDEEVEKAIDFK